MEVERRARESAPARYRPRRPSQSVLYRCVQEHLETWLVHCLEGHDDDGSVPEYIEREFRRYLDCGILAHGFARARCGDCGHTVVIAFSCKGRGVCPSCNSRRMAEVAAHLVEQAFPVLPVRQWVLSIPKRLRYFLQRDPAALSVDDVAAVQQQVRTSVLRWFVRHGTLDATDALDMAGWEHGGGFSLDASVRIEALDRADTVIVTTGCSPPTPRDCAPRLGAPAGPHL